MPNWLAARWPRALLVLGLATAAFGSSRPAEAQPKNIADLAEQLKSASDFRVRTQAALALGATEHGSAAAPLCVGLDDPNESVRSAAAAALGRLRKTDVEACLEHHARDASPVVRSVIERSLATVRLPGATKPPPPKPGDQYYVAIGTIIDRSGRSDGSVEALVESTMQQKLLGTRGCAVAPRQESTPDANRVIRKGKLKGFLLQVRVEPPRQSGHDLTVQVRVTMLSYPSRSLQGEFSPKLTMSGVAPGDVESENELIRMAVEKAVDSFAAVAASVN